MKDTKPDTAVMVVGAGPVGLTLALDLGRRGIKTTLIDSKPAPLRLPKMERSNPRTMEIYRRLGVIEQIRAEGYPASVPMDVLIVTSLAEPPLVQQVYPSVAETRLKIAACTDGTLPREPYQLISQYTLEPILLEELRRFSNVSVMLGTELASFDQDDDGVTASVRSKETGTMRNIRSVYLAGCDGANSSVRRQLGIEMEGRKELGTVTNIFFRCDEFFEKCQVPPGRHYNFAAVGASGGAAGTIVVQSDRKHFAYHTATPPGENLAEELRGVTGIDISPEILHVSRWTQNMLVAERHAAGRVFLAGDANHIYIPAGGLGMNTGIVDAINLSWKLDATLKGWGGPELLKSYNDERNPVARRNLAAVGYAVEGVVAWRGAWPREASEATPEGLSARRAFAANAEPLNRRVYEMHGTELGYIYKSSVIYVEQGAPPPDESYRYNPTTWPGAHLPHTWLSPDVAVFDRLGLGYVLLRLGDSQVDTAALEAQFKQIGAPLEVITLKEPAIRTVYDRDLLLIRPDLHVAWRGNELPQELHPFVLKVCGYI